uniref:Ribonuclease A-domain domain-containing protein n=1 Tax=Hucho hucho TaxID=62062 RepID=A0A4W5NCV7_9TELE
MTLQKSFLFLVLLCATVMADVNQQYNHFLKQHVDGVMTTQKCENQMRILNLNGPDGKCKVKNTFILANPNQVKAICTGGGTRTSGNLFQSNSPFSVVICTRTGGDSHPNCTYKGSSATKKVIIACDKNLPVHYDGDVDIGTTDGK